MHELNDALLTVPFVRQLGWTLLHFLWQGVLVGCVYALLRHMLRARSAATRYQLAMATLAILAVLPIITFIHLDHALPDTGMSRTLQALASADVGGASQISQTPISLFEQLQSQVRPLVSWIVPFWLLGVIVMTLRVGRGWRHARYLRETADFVPLPEWQTIMASLKSRLGIRKIIQLAVSGGISVPSVIGWLKPLVLIPPSALTGLSPIQIELILTHELAHISRQDYLWNLLQIVVETLLFYHPMVRWISQQVRAEREQCCDDIVVRLSGNAIDYARALTELESLRNPRTALLLGADGGQFMHRIHRLVGRPVTDAPISWIPALLAVSLLFAGGIAQFAYRQSPLQISVTDNPILPDATNPDMSMAHGTATVMPWAPTRIPIAAIMQANERPPAAVKILPAISAPMLPVLEDPTPIHAPESSAAPADSHTAIPSRSGGEVISRHTPTYPPLPLERGIEGSATVQFTLTAAGAITDVRVLQVAGSRLFGQAAMDAIRLWKFTPVMVANVPVSQRMIQEFDFRLNDPTQPIGQCRIPLGYHVCH